MQIWFPGAHPCETVLAKYEYLESNGSYSEIAVAPFHRLWMESNSEFCQTTFTNETLLN